MKDFIIFYSLQGNADQGFAATNHSGTQINLWGQMPGLNWDIRTPNSSNISGSYPMLNNNTIPYWSTQPSINMENFVSPQQLSAIANHLTQVSKKKKKTKVFIIIILSKSVLNRLL